MKIRLTSLAALVAAGAVAATVAATAVAATSTTDQARMEACFRAHGMQMGKPAVTNIRDCWRAHSYIMKR